MPKKTLAQQADERLSRECCGNCRFFGADESDPSDGICLRYPPTVFADEGEFISFYPSSGEAAWCGEFQRKMQG